MKKKIPTFKNDRAAAVFVEKPISPNTISQARG